MRASERYLRLSIPNEQSDGNEPEVTDCVSNDELNPYLAPMNCATTTTDKKPTTSHSVVWKFLGGLCSSITTFELGLILFCVAVIDWKESFMVQVMLSGVGLLVAVKVLIACYRYSHME